MLYSQAHLLGYICDIILPAQVYLSAQVTVFKEIRCVLRNRKGESLKGTSRHCTCKTPKNTGEHRQLREKECPTNQGIMVATGDLDLYLSSCSKGSLPAETHTNTKHHQEAVPGAHAEENPAHATCGSCTCTGSQGLVL